MPYDIRLIKGEYCVINTDKHENKGCSKTKAKAVAHMRFLYGVEHGMKPKGEK